MNIVAFIKDHRGLIGLVVSVLAQVAKHYGVEIDADGVINDALSAAALLATAQQHVHLKSKVEAHAEAAAEAKASEKVQRAASP